MPQIINTNMASLTAQRNLNNSQASNSTALERLSSGLRINSAKDDAAGLAISTRFESQTRGLGVAIRNAGDGISLAQTAEGALGAMTENLQRIRDLANQSVNSTNSPDDRIALQAEVEQRLAELRRTAEDTNFNGRKLLDGNFSGTFQIGANAGETVDVQISALTVDRLGSDAQSGVSAYGTDEALGNGDLIINGIAIGPSQSGDDSASVSNAEASAIAKVAAINRYTDQTGVEAFVNTNEVNGASMEEVAAAETGTITLNGVDIDISTTTNSNDSELASTRAAVMAAINAKSEQTGVRAVDSGSADNGVILVAEDGRNITITNNGGSTLTSAGTGLDIGAAGVTETHEGGYTLVANGATKEIVIGGGDGTGNGDLANAGLQRGTYDRATAVYTNEAQAGVLGSTGSTDSSILGTSADMTGNTTGADLDEALKQLVKNGGLQDGDIIINGVTIGASSALDDRASDTTAIMSDGAASGIAIAAAINRASESTGVYAKVNATVVVGGNDDAAIATSGSQMDLWINNVDIGTVTSQGDRQQDINTTVGLINAKAGQTGVTAEFNGKSITLTAEDGRNISVFALADSDQGTAAWGLDADVNGIGGGGTSGVLFSTGVGASVGFASSIDSTANATAAISLATLSGGAVFQFANFSSGLTRALVAETTHSTVTLESSREIVLEAGTAGTEGLEDSGFIRGTFGNGKDGMFLSEIDISTEEGAEAALTAIDNALDAVNSQRADLGALQNRFESTVSNLQISQENLTAANSRIRDADFAAETAELSRTQVLQQAGISVLAQANQRPQQVLSLLG